MRCKTICVAIALLGGVLAVSFALAQRSGNSGGPRPGRPNVQVPPRGELPADDKVMGLYLNFVRDAEKLAKDYEASGKSEQARAVYLEILKIVPNYKPAKDKLEQYQEKEATADKKSVDIFASKGWQETGIHTIAGKPISITATGTWTCKVNQEVGPEGLQVSEQLKDCGGWFAGGSNRAACGKEPRRQAGRGEASALLGWRREAANAVDRRQADVPHL